MLIPRLAGILQITAIGITISQITDTLRYTAFGDAKSLKLQRILIPILILDSSSPGKTEFLDYFEGFEKCVDERKLEDPVRIAACFFIGVSAEYASPYYSVLAINCPTSGSRN